MAFYRTSDYFPGVSASGDQSGNQFRVVYQMDADSVAAHDGSASRIPLGILCNEPRNGWTAQVAYVPGDIVKAECMADTVNISLGHALWCGSSGQLTRASTSGCRYIARALAAATGASEVIPVLYLGTRIVYTGSNAI